MADQWLRKASLVLENAAGDQLDISQLHFKFSISAADVQTPAAAQIRIYNLSDNTAQRIQKEFAKVTLRAGYEGNFGTIFVGDVKQIRRGKETSIDKYLDITAANGDMAYNFAVANFTLAAGWTATELYNALLQELSLYGITAGYAPPLPATVYPRATSFYGMVRDRLRELAAMVGCSWSIHDNRLYLIPISGYIPGNDVVMTSKTGMIGFPEQTINGIHVRCLLNPNVFIGRGIQIDNESVQEAQINAAYTAFNYFPSIAQDGKYKALAVTHMGDTRGQSWYTDSICQAIDGTASMSKSILTVVPNNG
ncbi:phage protein [Achromobacter ruhlandii]|uniref:phage protein n=1 Tax=Achromobacter ruhlandii TaxID=72557 RepID=UPI003BA32926